jgi:hypothetical protein
MSRPVSDRWLFVVLGVALFVSYAYFYQAGGWNQNSRFALVRAMTERDTLQIDAYRDATGDRAVWNGHFYSDKAPGVSLLALVPVEIVRAVNRASGLDPGSDAAITRTSYAATVVVSGVFTVAAALCVLWLALAWGYSRSAALFAATAYGVATPAWCYATLFMGHALCAGCLMIAFTAAVALGRDRRNAPRIDASPGAATRLAWVIGLFAGWAVVAEFPAAVPVLFICALALMTVLGASRDAVVTKAVAARVVAGGAIAGAILLAYNTAAFGSPLHLGYASEEGFEQLHTGLFGISRPELWRVRELLIGAYRGLLPVSPIIAVTPIGLVLLARARGVFVAALTAAAIAVLYLVLNASYFYWEGGWAFGPRQMTPALPFLALGLPPLWDTWKAAGRMLLGGAWVWGAALTLVAVSTTPQPPASIMRPVSELMLPAFAEGHLALNTQRFTDYRADEAAIWRHADPTASWNVGMKAGLTGRASLIPLAAVWAVCGGWLILMARSRAVNGAPASAGDSTTTSRRPAPREPA